MSKLSVIGSNEPVAIPADIASLIYVTGQEPGIRRRRAGKGFSYIDSEGKVLRDPSTLARIRSLAIPPAYTDVWIAADPGAHIQATGRDQRGRKQYRYHADWSQHRASTKFDRLVDFARSLPALRDQLKADMALSGLPRRKVLATVVHLLETTLIRVGNEDYVRQNKSFGLTTLRRRHVRIVGSELCFEFKGKSGRTWRLQVRNRRVAGILRACQELPGQTLFRYRDEAGDPASVSSSDVNAYLREVSNNDITAKHFRTWAGTVMAAAMLRALPAPATKKEAQRALRDAIVAVAQKLGNTPTVCRTSYVHPKLVDGFLNASLRWPADDVSPDDQLAGLRPEELATLRLLSEQACG